MKLKIATLEWPPYTCESCEGGGITTRFLKDFFEKHGYIVEFHFLPWARAIQETSSGEYDAVWPCWPNEVKEMKLQPSDTIFTSTLGFVGKKNVADKVKKFDDLNNYFLGAVVGYGYDAEYMALLNKKIKPTQKVVNDELNIEKLIAGRVDVIAIDHINFRYIMFKKYPQKKFEIEVMSIGKRELPLIFGINQNKLMQFEKLFKGKNFSKEFNKKIEEELNKIFTYLPQSIYSENNIFISWQ